MNDHRLVVSLQVQDVQESGRRSNKEGLALYPPSLTSSPAFTLTLTFLIPLPFLSQPPLSTKTITSSASSDSQVTQQQNPSEQNTQQQNSGEQQMPAPLDQRTTQTQGGSL